MKRLTSKDIANRHQEDSPLPDFYALSRDHPLPELPERPAPPVVAATQAGPAAAPPGEVAAAALQWNALETRRSAIVQRLENLLNCTPGEALLAAVGLAATAPPTAAAAPLPPASTTSSQGNPSGWGSLIGANPSTLSHAAPIQAQALALFNSFLQQQSNAAAAPAPTFPAPASSAAPSISDILALIGRATSSAPSATTVAAAQPPPPPPISASNPADLRGLLQQLMSGGTQAAVSVAPPQPGFQHLQQALQLAHQHGAANLSSMTSLPQGQFQLQQALLRAQSGGHPGDIMRYLQNQALGGPVMAPSTASATNSFGFAFGQQPAPYNFSTSQAAPSSGYPLMNAASSGVSDMAGHININQILNLIQQQQGNHQQQQQQRPNQQALQRQQDEQNQQEQKEEEEQAQQHEEGGEDEEDEEQEQQKPPAARTSHSRSRVSQAPPQPPTVTALSGLDPAQTAALLHQLQSQLLAANNRTGNLSSTSSPPPRSTTTASITGGPSTTTTSSESDSNQVNRHVRPLAAPALGFLVDGNGGNGIGGGGGAAAAAGGDANSNLILSILAAMNNMQQQNK
jgi:hypothetical protein